MLADIGTVKLAHTGCIPANLPTRVAPTHQGHSQWQGWGAVCIYSVQQQPEVLAFEGPQHNQTLVCWALTNLTVFLAAAVQSRMYTAPRPCHYSSLMLDCWLG